MCCVLAGALPLNASVIIQLKVVEGEGTVYRTGSHATRGLTVQVTDEAGKPVPNAAVSFRLPDSGPSGLFSTGLRTEVVNSDTSGRASVWGMQWNKTPGLIEVRITAVKDQARAGIISSQYLNDTPAPQAGGEGVFKPTHHGMTKWLVIGAVIGGAAAAGMAFGGSHSSTPVAVAPAAATSIGIPSITVGHP